MKARERLLAMPEGSADPVKLRSRAAKVADEPLRRFLCHHIGETPAAIPEVRVYTGGGYLYPQGDLVRLGEELQRFRDLGHTHAKIKIGATSLKNDLTRIETALELLGRPRCLAVDAMNVYGPDSALTATRMIEPYSLWWFEDISDPLDFDTQAKVAKHYSQPIAAGEALFSEAEAKLLHRYSGLRPARDILVFDPTHCYGLTHYLKIVTMMEAAGWPRKSFWPHGGHLFAVQIAVALGLGGCELNPLCFQPFGGLADNLAVERGMARLSDASGIGFEEKADLIELFGSLAN